MRNDFSDTLNRMLRMVGKSIQEVCDTGLVDPAYGRRLASGQKWNPSPETVMKLWIGLIFDSDLLKEHPDMVYGLAALLQAAAVTSASFSAVDDLRQPVALA